MARRLAVLACCMLCVACQKPQNDIIFGTKSYADSLKSQAGDGFIQAIGTLTGEDLFYKNNTVAVTCYKEKRECVVVTVEQIGPNQIGSLNEIVFMPITSWSPHQIVIGSQDDSVSCSRVTITISRDSGDVLWVEEPVNQTSPWCKDSSRAIRKYTFDDPPTWKAWQKH